MPTARAGALLYACLALLAVVGCTQPQGGEMVCSDNGSVTYDGHYDWESDEKYLVKVYSQDAIGYKKSQCHLKHKETS